MKRLFFFLLCFSAFACAQTNYARMISGVNAQTGTSYTFVAADSTRLTTFANASSVSVTLPAGTSQGFGAGNEFDAQNLGPGTVTITCVTCLIFSSSAIGSTTAQLATGQGVVLFSAGLNYYAVSPGGGGGGFTSNVGFQAIPAANPDLVWAVDPAGTCAYDANILTQGQIQVCNSGNGSLWLDSGSGPSQIFVTRLTSPASLTNGATPQYVTANNDFEILPPNSTNTLPAAQVGDTIRFNSAGDNNWDAVNYAQEFNAVYAVPGGTPVGFGPICNGNIGFATGTGNSDVFATATRRAGKTYNITPSASTSTVEGMTCGQNGSNSLFPMLAWYRFSALMAFGSSANSRYWVGLATWNNGSGTGTNSTVILNTTKLATDTPNSNLMGFRYSATTDTDFQAASCVAGGSCTVTDTGVAFDTNPHLFEMAMNSGGTSINYLIDGKVKATITSNIPAAAGNADGQVDMFWVADNKNTVTSPNATIYSMSFSLK